jgi:hypothetical protein
MIRLILAALLGFLAGATFAQPPRLGAPSFVPSHHFLLLDRPARFVPILVEFPVARPR